MVKIKDLPYYAVLGSTLFASFIAGGLITSAFHIAETKALQSFLLKQPIDVLVKIHVSDI
jgi:hypothetical protein